MRDRKRVWTLCLFVCLLTACPGSNRLPHFAPPDLAADESRNVSREIAVDIFLDATLSMKGFLVPGTTSYYVQTPQLLERAVGKGWEGARATFYRFGTQIAPIEGRAYMEAANPGFYTNPEYTGQTRIENVLEAADPDRLTVIVTDLFQNDADASLLNARIKEKYLAKNLAVGVLGIKSEFAGTVYDVGINRYSFSYASGSEPQSFRPFYVLMLGRHADIARYYETLQTSGLQNFPIKEFVIFSPELVNPISSFANAEMTAQERLVETSDVVKTEASGVKQFRLRGTEQASFEASLAFSPLPYTVALDSASLAIEVMAWQNNADSMQESEAAKSALAAREARMQDGRLFVQTAIESTGIPSEARVCYRLVVRPTRYQLPAWIEAWNMPVKSIEQWRQAPTAFDGTTTFNLHPFLSDLWDTVVQLHRPSVAACDFCVAK